MVRAGKKRPRSAPGSLVGKGKSQLATEFAARSGMDYAALLRLGMDKLRPGPDVARSDAKATRSTGGGENVSPRQTQRSPFLPFPKVPRSRRSLVQIDSTMARSREGSAPAFQARSARPLPILFLQSTDCLHSGRAPRFIRSASCRPNGCPPAI